MTKNRNRVYKITLSAILAALSIVIKLAFDLWLPTNLFGFPFYGIPLIISGFLLGPLYGFMIAVVADTVNGIVLGYKPMFVFSTIAWAVIPCLLTKETKGIKWWVVIFLTYLSATLFNSLALWFHFSLKLAIGSLPFRASFIPAFSLLIAGITTYIFERVKELNLNFLGHNVDEG